jgi:hypothetical protein
MPFKRESVVQPRALGDMSITIFDPMPGSVEGRQVTARVQVIMSDNSIIERVMEITDVFNASANALVDTLGTGLRALAMTEILPEEVVAALA